MACLIEHNWGWPRRRGGKDVQVCVSCGTERESLVRFDGPRYRKTQEAESPARNLVVRLAERFQAASAN